MNNYVSLSSLAMDLKRAAIGYYRNSTEMAERFYFEALKRKQEIDTKLVPSYLANLFGELEKLGQISNNLEKAEKALMLSTLFQNAAIFSKTDRIELGNGGNRS